MFSKAEIHRVDQGDYVQLRKIIYHIRALRDPKGQTNEFKSSYVILITHSFLLSSNMRLQ